MKFMLLIYTDESRDLQPGEPGHQELWDAYVALDEAAREAGVLLDSRPLQPTSSAVTVRVRNGARSAEPGPFEQTQLQLAGYYLLDCRDMDDAIDWAARIPGAAQGYVEVRPLFEID